MAENQCTTPTGSGIYLIRCLANGKVYVGSAKSIKVRWREHRRWFAGGRHHSPYLQRAWNKYGEDGFTWEVLELAPIDQLLIREQYYIDKFQSANPKVGYNILAIAGSSLGYKHTAETLAKLKGRKVSPEARAKQSLAMKGRSRGAFSPEHRAALSQAGKGRPASEKTRLAVAAANRARQHTPEQRAKIAKVNRGRKHTPEELAKMSVAQTGRKHTVETCAKMRKRWRERKQKLPKRQMGLPFSE